MAELSTLKMGGHMADMIPVITVFVLIGLVVGKAAGGLYGPMAGTIMTIPLGVVIAVAGGAVLTVFAGPGPVFNLWVMIGTVVVTFVFETIYALLVSVGCARTV